MSAITQGIVSCSWTYDYSLVALTGRYEYPRGAYQVGKMSSTTIYDFLDYYTGIQLKGLCNITIVGVGSPHSIHNKRYNGTPCSQGLCSNAQINTH